MESLPGEDGFKYLPLRMFQRDRPLLQKLYKTIGEDRQRRTLRDLIREALPERDPNEGKYFRILCCCFILNVVCLVRNYSLLRSVDRHPGHSTLQGRSSPMVVRAFELSRQFSLLMRQVKRELSMFSTLGKVICQNTLYRRKHRESENVHGQRGLVELLFVLNKKRDIHVQS